MDIPESKKRENDDFSVSDTGIRQRNALNYYHTAGGGFPGIYSWALTERCWAADGTRVILSTAWRSSQVGDTQIIFLLTRFKEFCHGLLASL